MATTAELAETGETKTGTMARESTHPVIWAILTAPVVGAEKVQLLAALAQATMQLLTRSQQGLAEAEHQLAFLEACVLVENKETINRVVRHWARQQQTGGVTIDEGTKTKRNGI